MHLPDAASRCRASPVARDRRRTTPAKHDASLTAALLRISASLNLEAVLTEILERARTLADARAGCIVIIDETGGPQDFVSAGLPGEEAFTADGLVVSVQAQSSPELPQFGGGNCKGSAIR